MHHKVLIHDATHSQWLSFTRPREIFCVTEPGQILSILNHIHEQVKSHHLWAAGWLSYEASVAFDQALITHQPTQFPLLWFGLFESCEAVCIDSLITEKHVDIFQQTVWSLNSGFQSYSEKIKHIKNEIKNGNTYQVNYTIRQFADLDISPEDAFLGFAANARYGAFIDSGRFAICSASPELFFDFDNGQISSRPMKGTSVRGRFLSEDNLLKEELFHSEKNRAENLMIVDMIRNDIGRIAKTGSVQVPKLFEIEKYPTVWQMTSTVTAQSQASLPDVFEALFPCASITGAPKANTMKIINQLEPGARNIYTGTIGFVSPQMRMQFNVAIRTVLIDKQYNQAEYGVGGGIVWDSSARSEYEECLTKSKVLSGQGTYTHQLLETILWTSEGGFFLLDYHLARLANSAEYFDFAFDHKSARSQLHDVIEDQTTSKRIRLLVCKSGEIEIQLFDIDLSPSKSPYKVKLAAHPIDSNDIYLFHKTTQRKVYQSYLDLYADYNDVLLINGDDEITESCIANLVVESEGIKYTPPVDCGLLNGTYRQYLIDQNELKEKRINKQMLLTSDKIWLINSVRKMWPIELDF